MLLSIAARRVRRPIVVFLVATLLGTGLLPGSGPPPVAGATLPTGFQDQTPITGLNLPTAVQFASDGRVFIAEKSGLIKVFDDLNDTTPTTFADLRTEVYNFWDRGLLGLALDPNFPASPYVYAMYTRDALPGGASPHWGTAGANSDPCPTPPGPTTDGCVVTGRLVRLTASGNTATGSPTVLLDGWCQQWPSHSVGDLAFGPDGALYVSGGEGANFDAVDYGQWGGSLSGTPTVVNPCGDPPGSAGTALTPPTAEGGALRAQDVRTSADPTGLSGAILRINPATGAAMADNPMIASVDLNTRKIVAYGMRNPFRIAFRPGSGELWLGDVGWSDYEEIDRLTSPSTTVRNLGWPCYEGPLKQPSYDAADLTLCEDLYAAGPGAVTAPWHSYKRDEPMVPGSTCTQGTGSISGLAFYPSGEYPSTFNGAMFAADYARRCISVFFAGAGGAPDLSSGAPFITNTANPVDITIGPGSDLYYVDFDGGALHRIRYYPGNQPPTAVIHATPSSGPAPLVVSFDGSDSNDPDVRDPLTYSWDLDGDGVFGDSTAAAPSATYDALGAHTVRLTVTDGLGASNTATTIVSVESVPPQAVIDTPTASTTWQVGGLVSFSGHASDGNGSPIPAGDLHWLLRVLHCPSTCHAHTVQSWDGVASGSFLAPDHEYPSYLEFTLTADLGNGLNVRAGRIIDPKTVQLGFASSPSGRSLSVAAETGVTPFTFTTIVGSSTQVSAPNQSTANTEFTFRSWSDGGAATHTILAPTGAKTYTATYTALRRLAGADRYATAAAVSAATFGPGVAAAFVATGTDFADALAGGPAAAQLGGPLLLVSGSSIPAATATELSRLKPQRIVVLGGSGVVSNAVLNALDAYTTGPVSRLAGADRYATAAAVSAATFSPGVAAAFVATGADFADALAGGPAAAHLGAPLLLTRPNALPAALTAELSRLKPARIYVLGGSAAVSGAVLNALDAYTTGPVSRLAGADRYATAAAIAGLWTSAGALYTATGLNFPDGLAGAAAAGHQNLPLLLVRTASVPTVSGQAIARLHPTMITILGGSGVITTSAANALKALLGSP